MDTPLFRRSISALRCFKRAMEIDYSNCKLWIEYGSLAYILHSHASRQLKWVRKIKNVILDICCMRKCEELEKEF